MTGQDKLLLYAVMQQNKVVGITTQRGIASPTTYILPFQRFNLHDFLAFRGQSYRGDTITRLKTSLWMGYYDYTSNMLFKAHGLSLSDQYWYAEIQPKNLFAAIIRRRIPGPRWEDINYFRNGFKYGIGHYAQHLTAMTDEMKENICYSPDYCTRGYAPKYWSIVNGKRILTKFSENGNRYSIHKLQLVQIIIKALNGCLIKTGQPLIDYVHYDFRNETMHLGNRLCAKCECFCSEDEEFIPFPYLFNRKLNEKDLRKYVSSPKTYIEFINTLGFLLSHQVDIRHLGIIRNVRTKKTRLAPLFGIDEIGKENIDIKIPNWLDICVLDELKSAIKKLIEEEKDEELRQIYKRVLLKVQALCSFSVAVMS